MLRHLSDVGGASLDTTVPDAAVLAFERVSGTERVLVVLNTHPTHAATLSLETGFAPGTRLRDRLYGEASATVGEDGSAEVTLPPRETRIFFREP